MRVRQCESAGAKGRHHQKTELARLFSSPQWQDWLEREHHQQMRRSAARPARTLTEANIPSRGLSLSSRSCYKVIEFGKLNNAPVKGTSGKVWPNAGLAMLGNGRCQYGQRHRLCLCAFKCKPTSQYSVHFTLLIASLAIDTSGITRVPGAGGLLCLTILLDGTLY